MSEIDKPAEDFRAWSRTQWGELGEKAAKVLAVALDAKKTVRRSITCSSCGVRQQKELQVGDPKIALDALSWLTDSGFGRAPTAKDEAASGSFVMVNKVMLVDADGAKTLDWLDERGLLGKPRADVERAWTVGHVTPAEHAEFIADYEVEHPDTE